MDETQIRILAVSQNPLDTLLTFAGLQMLDVLATLACLAVNIPEGNPFVRWTIQIAGNPVIGLIYTKMFALLVGLVCCKWGRLRLLRCATAAYTFVIGWNLTALAVTVTHNHWPNS